MEEAMSDISNDLLIERVQEVMGDPHIVQDTKDLIQGYLDNNDWESIYFIVTHLPESEGAG